ncbi:cell division control 6 [Striga asiatica]|uniref:Cell division control 6 n=1 Tax=Striga asiatica TaxID=4170 RepID=A0A5A7PZ58_STRAF|nr:cell division control 6 [Striga asiatica]
MMGGMARRCRNRSDSNRRIEVLQTHALATWLRFPINSMSSPLSDFASQGETRNNRCRNALGGRAQHSNNSNLPSVPGSDPDPQSVFLVLVKGWSSICYNLETEQSGATELNSPSSQEASEEDEESSPLDETSHQMDWKRPKQPLCKFRHSHQRKGQGPISLLSNCLNQHKAGSYYHIGSTRKGRRIRAQSREHSLISRQRIANPGITRGQGERAFINSIHRWISKIARASELLKGKRNPILY